MSKDLRIHAQRGPVLWGNIQLYREIRGCTPRDEICPSGRCVRRTRRWYETVRYIRLNSVRVNCILTVSASRQSRIEHGVAVTAIRVIVLRPNVHSIFLYGVQKICYGTGVLRSAHIGSQNSGAPYWDPRMEHANTLLPNTGFVQCCCSSM